MQVEGLSDEDITTVPAGTTGPSSANDGDSADQADGDAADSSDGDASDADGADADAHDA